MTRQPELREGGDELQGDVHGDGLRSIEDVANGVEIEGGGLFEEGEATQEKGISEVGALEMGGVVLGCEQEPEKGVEDEVQGREVHA